MSFLDDAKIMTEKEFGLCDYGKSTQKPAYTDTKVENKADKWLAIVNNSQKVEVGFVAIDNNPPVLEAMGFKDEKRCDALLKYDKTIVFVELKDDRHKGWVRKATEQLEGTIKLFRKNSVANQFMTMKAYVANRAHRNPTQRSYVDRITGFMKNFGCYLYVKGDIEI
ncbi:hypothetical protein RsTz2092_13630 [Deferribacterales bacterium RsTz2092]|nr:hypothetical protein AGMMS49941_12700 [Deferribacterales bacterium]